MEVDRNENFVQVDVNFYVLTEYGTGKKMYRGRVLYMYTEMHDISSRFNISESKVLLTAYPFLLLEAGLYSTRFCKIWFHQALQISN